MMVTWAKGITGQRGRAGRCQVIRKQVLPLWKKHHARPPQKELILNSAGHSTEGSRRYSTADTVDGPEEVALFN